MEIQTRGAPLSLFFVSDYCTDDRLYRAGDICSTPASAPIFRCLLQTETLHGKSKPVYDYAISCHDINQHNTGWRTMQCARIKHPFHITVLLFGSLATHTVIQSSGWTLMTANFIYENTLFSCGSVYKQSDLNRIQKQSRRTQIGNLVLILKRFTESLVRHTGKAAELYSEKSIDMKLAGIPNPTAPVRLPGSLIEDSSADLVEVSGHVGTRGLFYIMIGGGMTNAMAVWRLLLS